MVSDELEARIGFRLAVGLRVRGVGPVTGDALAGPECIRTSSRRVTCLQDGVSRVFIFSLAHQQDPFPRKRRCRYDHWRQ
jgi:hypothetical protein